MSGEWWTLLVAAVQGITVIALFLVAIFVLVTVAAGLHKTRRTGRASGARSLEERVGEARWARFRPGTAPRGVVDQLNTPELQESAQRKGS